MDVVLRMDPEKAPVVALESTVIAHGLPYPENLRVANDLEKEVESVGAVPATVGILDGRVVVGMNKDEIEKMARAKTVKVGVREIPYAVARRLNGDTTVSATVRIASSVGIKVFSTGGIGGVHRGDLDVSQDLVELSRRRMVVVSAGAKSILDLRKTVELLETLGVVLVGYGTDEFPAFYSRESGVKLNMRVESVEDVVDLFLEMEKMDYESSLLVVNPIPKEYALESEYVENLLERAEREARLSKISGKDLTPFLLKRLSELSEGKTLEANIALLMNNANLAGRIAVELFDRYHIF